MMRGGRTPLTWRTALLALALLCVDEQAHAQQNLEDAVKATFIFRFASFAEWPATAFPDPASPLIICVSGDSELARLVEESAAGQSVANRDVAVRVTDAGAASAQCHILYLALSPEATRNALEATAGQSVLTVTDARYGSARGIIHFALSGGRVRFHIDRRAAERKGISLNARLLNIALTVNGTPR